jgi:hypothetical protein
VNRSGVAEREERRIIRKRHRKMKSAKKAKYKKGKGEREKARIDK